MCALLTQFPPKLEWIELTSSYCRISTLLITLCLCAFQSFPGKALPYEMPSQLDGDNISCDVSPGLAFISCALSLGHQRVFFVFALFCLDQCCFSFLVLIYCNVYSRVNNAWCS